MNISFTKKQEKYITEQVTSGDYQNKSEVIRDALRLHEIYREKVMTDLRKEIQAGFDSGISELKIKDILENKKVL